MSAAWSTSRASVEQLAALVAIANRHVDETRYQVAGQDLGAVLTELHVHAVSGRPDVRRAGSAGRGVHRCRRYRPTPRSVRVRQAGWVIGSLGWIAERFDRRALSYDHSAVHRWQAAQAGRFLAPRPGADVLDAATGTGLVTRELVGWLGPSGRVVDIDVSVAMLRMAGRVCNRRECCFIRADAQVLPFRGGVFDAVVCVAAVPYFADPQAALAEWRRVCRPQGQVVFTVPALDGITSSRLLRQAAAGEGIKLDDPGGPLADPERRDQLAAATGWTCEEVCEVVFAEPRPIRGQPSHSSTRAFANRCERRQARFASGSGSGLRRCIALSPLSTTWCSWCGCGRCPPAHSASA